MQRVASGNQSVGAEAPPTKAASPGN
ncbi:DUF6053 domain-containing protein [Lysobacter enzymogenes]